MNTLSKEIILNELALSQWLSKTVSNIVKDRNLKNDATSELFIILCGKSDEYILKAYNGGYFKYMIVQILQTMYNSPRHPFYINFRKPSQSLDLTPDIAIDTPIDLEGLICKDMANQLKEDARAIAIDRLNQVHRVIWTRYESSKSGKEVSRYFQVPYSYIRSVLNEIKKDIKNNYK